MKQLATVTVVGKDKTGVAARVTNFLSEPRANLEALEALTARAGSRAARQFADAAGTPILTSEVKACKKW